MTPHKVPFKLLYVAILRLDFNDHARLVSTDKLCPLFTDFVFPPEEIISVVEAYLWI
jgi:hypothetical protein